jgi:tRNA A37 methylthiotransferase MiaB
MTPAKQKELSLPIEEVIKRLEELRNKGAKNVQIEGTLMCKEDGNTVIASTEPQM